MQVQPHHAQYARTNAQTLPPFFPGFSPSLFTQVGVTDPNLIHHVSIKLIKTIVLNAEKPNAGWFSIQAYVQLSQNEFNNQMFVAVVATALRLYSRAMQVTGNQFYAALQQVANAAIWDWIVAFGKQQPLVSTDRNINMEYQNVVNALRQLGAQLAPQQPVIPVMAPSYHQAVPGYPVPQQTTYVHPAPTSALMDAVDASPALTEFTTAAPIPYATNYPIPIIETQSIEPQAKKENKIMIEGIDEIMGKDHYPVLDARESHFDIQVVNQKFEVSVVDGGVMKYEDHRLDRLLSSNAPFQTTGINPATSALADHILDEVAIRANAVTLPNEEDDIKDDVKLVGNSKEDVVILADDPERVVQEINALNIIDTLAEELDNGTNAALFNLTLKNKNASIDNELCSLFIFKIDGVDDLDDGVAMQMLLRKIRDARDSKVMRVAAMAAYINRHMTERLYQVLNFEAGLRGGLDSFVDDYRGIAKYLREKVNDTTADYVEGAMIERYLELAHMAPVRYTVVYANINSDAFPFIVTGDSGYVNASVTPLLHAACKGILALANKCDTRGAYLVTRDNAMVRLFETVHGEKYFMQKVK